jgi:hypothetical protein
MANNCSHIRQTRDITEIIKDALLEMGCENGTWSISGVES